MKFYKITALIVTLLVLGVFTVQAQWDDVYYDPAKDVIVERTNQFSSNGNDYRNSQSYDDEQGYYNDYDFFYTSRIRRFHRPMYGFGFFDPVYIDAGYYDPFMRSGMTVLIYDDFYSRRMFARNGFGFGFGYSPFRSSFGYDPFYSPFGFGSSMFGNRFGFGFGASPFGYYSAFNGLYCPPSWGNSYSYNNVNNFYSDTNSRGTTYAPRRGGSSITPNPDVVQRRGTVGTGRTVNPATVDGRRPYPYSPTGANSLKPTTREPQFNTTNSGERSRTRSTAIEPYSRPRNSTINSNGNSTRTRAITPSSSTRTRTINSGTSRSISPSSRTRINSGSSSSPSRISSGSSGSSSVRSSGSSSGSSRSSSGSSAGSTRKRGNE